MRAGEITGLRWCDVDFEHDIISIDHAIVYLGDEQLKNNRTIEYTEDVRQCEKDPHDPKGSRCFSA